MPKKEVDEASRIRKWWWNLWEKRVRLIDCRRNGNQHVTDDAIRRQMNTTTTIFFFYFYTESIFVSASPHSHLTRQKKKK